MKKNFFLLLVLVMISACAPTPGSAPAPTQESGISLQANETTSPTPSHTFTALASATKRPPTGTFTPTATELPSETPSPTETETAAPTATRTETLGEMLKTRIVFFLIIPEKKRDDACGDILLDPIISKRYRTGDKLQDVQIALNMLFSVSARRYGAYYNALWQTRISIASYTYNKERDYMTIEFTGDLPVLQMSKCDKHGAREQIWKTFAYYGIKEKTFKWNGEFLIDHLSR